MDGTKVETRSPLDMTSTLHNSQLDPHHPHASRSRKMVGKYVLLKTLGKGSIGKVKLAEDLSNNQKVAVKIVSRKLRSNYSAYATPAEVMAKKEKDRKSEISREIRTIREASIMLLLDHPFIARVDEMIVTDSYYYLIMEYVDGGQLLDYIISHGKLKEKQARQFARQIASALDYCHRTSIVHRDLKVENILISRTGNIKIIDFGLSNVFSPTSHLSTFCGSLYFAAPELLSGIIYTGPEVDVWSFGIVLYVLVCGHVPFDDPTMSGMHQKVKKGHVDYPSHLSSDIKSLLQRMILVDPYRRATMSEIIVHPWMVKGFDRPVENNLPKRKPLQLPIDMNVVHQMRGFEFGSEEQIKEELEYIISSKEYQTAAKELETMYNNPATNNLSSLNDSSSHFTYHLLKRRSFPCAVNDPQNMPAAYHPLVSIYYLVKERIIRKQLMEASAIRQSIEDEDDKSSNKSTNRLSAPIGFSYTAGGKTEFHNPTSKEDIYKKALCIDIPSSDQNSSLTSSSTKQSVFRRLSRRLSRQRDNDSNKPPKEDIPAGIKLPDDATTPIVAVNGSPVENTTTISTEQGESNNSISLKLNRFLRRARSSTVKDLPSTKMTKSNEDQHTRSYRRKSAIHSISRDNERYHANSMEEGGHLAPPMSSNEQTIDTKNESLGHADECIRPVYLKGLFSVSTTSTKKPSAIRDEIIRVLNKKPDIEFREDKGKFECIMSKAKIQANLQPDFYELSDDEESNTLKHLNEDPTAVLFDIYIVKIPWLLGMRGVQFRRISGDPWKYKSTCDRILNSLYL